MDKKSLELFKKAKAALAEETKNAENAGYSKTAEKTENAGEDEYPKLPSGCFFLGADDVLCLKQPKGDARYPYSCDGLTYWAYSSGNAKIEESTFNIALPFAGGREPNLCFFVGEKRGDKFFPVSITGAAKFPFEENVKRFVIFSPDAARYFVETENVVAMLKASVTDKKQVVFTVFVENVSGGKIETYSSAYFDLMLSHALCENIETKWYRRCNYKENEFDFSVTEYLSRTSCFEHTATIKRETSGYKSFNTTSRAQYRGGENEQITVSSALINGKFDGGDKAHTEFTDTAIAGDIIPLTLEKCETAEVSYTLTVNGGHLSENYRAAKIGEDIPPVKIKGNWKEVPAKTLEYFIKNVHRQNEFCARAKNYAGPYIGIRDIFQQLESALLWIPDYCRGKIVEALNYIGVDGRAPRQYSYPAAKGAVPPMDLRPFVDQGVWIISTVYTYLAYTNDFSVLDEVCGYYEFNGNEVLPNNEKDTVLDHLVRITEFLRRNLDRETGCLHALYGDWNDALDGLGKTTDKDKEYGTGVSVMATLQYCRNLAEMSEILRKKGENAKADEYVSVRDGIKKGLLKYAVVENEKGERKILHGWGDKRSYFVGSFSDNDGESRDGLTADAFWIISGALEWDKSLKNDILSAYKRLDSKYGLKTFNPYFAPTNDKVGRITRLPKGTAENGAVYIHATLFGIRSLFLTGEDELAYEQIYKILPPAHKMITTTPFVMPNSYIENEEKGFDGESMSDWFTGSGCVLLKTLYFDVFGLKADLSGLTIAPAGNMPFGELSVSVNLKGAKINLTLKKGENKSITVNGKATEGGEVRFENSELKGEINVEIVL